MSRHNTRRTELERLLRDFIKGISTEREDGKQARDVELDDAPRFWTRNMPDEALGEDTRADAIAAHVYGWESDIALAEERLEKEIKRGHLVPLDSQPVELRSAEERALAMLAPSKIPYERLSAVEKEVIRFRALFEMRDQEESFPSKRGRGSPIIGYGFAISFDWPVSNREIKWLSDKFLDTKMQVVFNKAHGPVKITNPLQNLPAAFSIHPESTGTTHLHIQYDTRDKDGVAVQIPPQVWRSFDEHWALIWSEFVRDPEQFRAHMGKKEQIKSWKRETRKRRKQGLPPTPKPQRVADTRDQKLLKLRSQINTDLRTLGIDPAKFRIVDRLGGNRSNDPTRQLMVEHEIAEQEFVHALATGSQLEEVRLRSQRAGELRRALFDIFAARKRAKKNEPQLYRTDQQTKRLEQLTQERLTAAQDDQATALLVGYHRYFEARAATSHAEMARFLDEREHLKVPLEGGSAPRSLSEIESEIAAQAGCQNELPQSTHSPKNAQSTDANRLEELNGMRAEIERQLGEREAEIRRTLDRYEWQHTLTGEAVEDAKRARSDQGKKMPAPVYGVKIYLYLDGLAHRERDAVLAQHLREAGRSYSLTSSRALEITEVEFGREYIARQSLLMAEAGYKRALEQGRGKGRDGDSALKNALSGQEGSISDLKQKEATYRGAKHYEEVRRASVNECLEVIGASREEIAPRFLSDEFEQLKEYVRQMPPGKGRTEFKEAIKRAEEAGRRREELAELRKQLPLPDQEMARLLGHAQAAQFRAEEAQYLKEQYERICEFRKWPIKIGEETQHWSFATVESELAASSKPRHLPQLASVVRQAIDKDLKDFRGESIHSAREAEELRARASAALAVHEAHGHVPPEPVFTPVQEQEIERSILITHNGAALEEFSRREFERDEERAAGRSLAREIVLIVQTDAHELVEGELNRELENISLRLPFGHLLSTKIEEYQKHQRSEGQLTSDFRETATEISAGQREAYLKFKDEEPRAIFSRHEMDVISKYLPTLGDDSLHDDLVKDINRAWLRTEDGKLKQVEPLSYRTLQIQENEPHTRAGLLMGEYQCASARLVEKYETKQDYSVELREKDRAKEEMNLAVADHRRIYGTQPRIILDQEKSDFINSVIKRFTSPEANEIRKTVQNALVIGKSGAVEPIDFTPPQRSIPDRSLQISPQLVKIPRNPGSRDEPKR